MQPPAGHGRDGLRRHGQRGSAPDAAGIRGSRSRGHRAGLGQAVHCLVRGGGRSLSLRGRADDCGDSRLGGRGFPGVFPVCQGDGALCLGAENGPSGPVPEGRPQPRLLGGYGGRLFPGASGGAAGGAGRLFRAPPAVFRHRRRTVSAPGAGYRGEGREPLRLHTGKRRAVPAED